MVEHASAYRPADISAVLPEDRADAVLVGRVWDPAAGGPLVVAVRGDEYVDLSASAATMSELLERPDAVDVAAGATAPVRGSVADLVRASLEQDADSPRLLAPVDLQVVKACGVTFAESLLERVIEERAGGDRAAAAPVRERVLAALGGPIHSLRPGSPAAAELKRTLIEEGLWSQYLEVGIGPDPEVFTKAPVLASVGFGSGIGVPSTSEWNNPEPELVLVADSAGRLVGATLGNDVNLRDVEGRSALLLGKAKDNNASSSIGPFIRLFDGRFTPETVRQEEILLTVEGTDGYVLEGRNSVARMSRTFEDLVHATHGRHHQYPDGFALYTGTLFAPVQDRDVPGEGFTHKPGDVVSIRSRHLGALVNTVGRSEELPEWTFGIAALFRYLAGRRGNISHSH
ncbi:fumarylacetoacetate hydrolase family protein [Naasia sp. SYSU D00057]|uniref:fumarylacetoacetate hydrolase family protein n=1 Tax=Naasia sp. SYSU D00057 TaxID=2817380 RepID=UPI0027DE3F58|nr:fumarylacetoacetate hydrolase family protein [Naasia sp. SYSU D00057]